MGALTIHVTVGVAAHIHADLEQASLEVDPARFLPVEVGKEYRSSDYDTAANRVQIQLEMGMGTVRII